MRGGLFLDSGNFWMLVFSRVPCESVYSRYSAHTGRLERLARDTGCGVVSALVQLDHSSDSRLIAAVDAQKDSLKRQILIFARVGSLATTVGSKTQELGEHQEAILKILLGIRLRCALGLGHGLSLFLLVLLGQALLRVSLDRGNRVAPLIVDFLDLGQLLFVAGELGLESWFVVDLTLLVGIDDLGGEELVDGLVFIFDNQGLGLGGIGLDREDLQSALHNMQ